MTHIKKQTIYHDYMNYGIYDHSVTTIPINWDPHWHPEYEINYVYQGPVTIFTNGKTYTLNSNELFFTNKNVIHFCKCPECKNQHFVSLLFGEEFVFPGNSDPIFKKYIQNLNDRHLGFPDIITAETPGGPEILESVRNFITIFMQKKPAFEIALRNELLRIYQIAFEYNLFVEAHDPQSALNSIVHQAILYLQQNFMYPISIHDLAAKYHVTHSHFCRLFKSSVGTTPLTYLQDYRLSTAAPMIIQTNDPINSIAYACGFDDLNYFSRCFKKKHGLSPSEYRKRSQNLSIF